jgi:mRNA-degrading endonuclease RelE of RelBE toxin-antitoxin system
MTVKTDKRFFRDLARIRSEELLDTTEFILDLTHSTDDVESIPGFKWLTGAGGFARISVGTYRIGLRVDGNTVIFKCILHRSLVYKSFP